MTLQTTPTPSVPASKHAAPRLVTWLIFLSLMVIISLACHLSDNGQPVPRALGEFEKTDCDVPGISFPDSGITISFTVNDIYAGPYLICNVGFQGAHGSVNYYISDIAYKNAKLTESYNELHTSIQGFVDQANAWNSSLKSGDPLMDSIDLIRNDSNRYVVVISSESNVQHCYRGYGYGAEVVLGKYLIHIGFESCEMGDALEYVTLMKDLESAANKAIYRIEGLSFP